MKKGRRQRNKLKDALIAGTVCLVAIGSILYFVPRFLSGDKEAGGRIVRIEPVNIQIGSSGTGHRETLRLSVRIGVSGVRDTEAVCRFAPHVIERIQGYIRKETGKDAVSLDAVVKNAEQEAQEELIGHIGAAKVLSLRLVKGEQTAEGVRFPKPLPNTVTCGM